MDAKVDPKMVAILDQYDRLPIDSPGVVRILRGNDEQTGLTQKYKAAFQDLKEAVRLGDLNMLVGILERKDLTADEKKIILRVRDKGSGDTLLHWVGVFGRYYMVDTLVDNGAPIMLTNSDKLTASEWTERHMLMEQKTRGLAKPPMHLSETYEHLKIREKDRLRVG